MRRRIIMTVICVGLVAFMWGERRAAAQGIVRESESGEDLARVLRHSNQNDTYNLKVGPIELRADAELSTSFDDNIGLTKSGRIADFVITPNMSFHAKWAVTELNTLTLDFGVGYELYALHSQYNNVVLTPNSNASFNFFVGEVAINLHDNFSYEQDPTQIGQLSNQVRLARFQNDAGIGATWDLNAFIASLDYDHSNLWVTTSVYDYLTNQSDTLAPKITFVVDQSVKAGISGSISDVRYEKHFENNYTTESIGPFVTAQLTENISVQAQAGGYFSQYDTGGGNGDSQDISSYYGSAGISHRINDAVGESLTVGREFLPGLTSNFTERIYANYQASWKAMSNLNLAGNLWWENLTDSDASFRADSNRYGAGFDVADNLNEHLSLTFDYQFILKDADPSFLSYYQNVGTVGVRYNF